MSVSNTYYSIINNKVLLNMSDPKQEVISPEVIDMNEEGLNDEYSYPSSGSFIPADFPIEYSPNSLNSISSISLSSLPINNFSSIDDAKPKVLSGKNFKIIYTTEKIENVIEKDEEDLVFNFEVEDKKLFESRLSTPYTSSNPGTPVYSDNESNLEPLQEYYDRSIGYKNQESQFSMMNTDGSNSTEKYCASALSIKTDPGTETLDLLTDDDFFTLEELAVIELKKEELETQEEMEESQFLTINDDAVLGINCIIEDYSFVDLSNKANSRIATPEPHSYNDFEECVDLNFTRAVFKDDTESGETTLELLSDDELSSKEHTEQNSLQKKFKEPEIKNIKFHNGNGLHNNMRYSDPSISSRGFSEVVNRARAILKRNKTDPEQLYNKSNIQIDTDL